MRELIATIHFIGLALFSTQVPGENGLRVLLPRIESKHTGHRIPLTPSEETVQASIESHVAAIVYDGSAVLQEIGWTPEDLPSQMVAPSASTTKFRMVRLNGERITFHATGSNPAVGGTVSLALPKPTCGLEFERPIEVAGMVVIPGGTLSTCMVTDRRRFDTRLTLQNNGVITVWAVTEGVTTASTKAVVLRGDATVYVVNVPASAMSTTAVQGMDTAHYLAYYDLLRTDANCERKLTDPAAVDSCPASALLITNASAASRTDGTVTIAAVNSECSNTAWP